MLLPEWHGSFSMCLAFAALALAVFAEAEASQNGSAPESGAQCLLTSLGGRRAAFDAEWIISRDGSSIAFAGCFPTWVVDVPVQNTSDAAADSPPNVTDATQCAATCQLQRGAALDIQFVFRADRCYCLKRDHYITMPTAQRSMMQPCPGSDVRAFVVSLQCPLNTTLCTEVDGCRVQRDCCVRAGEEPDILVPYFYRQVVQWVAVVIIALAIIEGIVYTAVRVIMRRRREAAALRDEMVPLREAEDAASAASRLVKCFATATVRNRRSEALTGTDNELPTCVICLEDLSSAPCILFPCNHELHTKCAEEFLAHQLIKTNDVTCPMCRAKIVELDTDQGQLVAASQPARTGTTINIDNL